MLLPQCPHPGLSALLMRSEHPVEGSEHHGACRNTAAVVRFLLGLLGNSWDYLAENHITILIIRWLGWNFHDSGAVSTPPCPRSPPHSSGHDGLPLPGPVTLWGVLPGLPDVPSGTQQ